MGSRDEKKVFRIHCRRYQVFPADDSELYLAKVGYRSRGLQGRKQPYLFKPAQHAFALPSSKASFKLLTIIVSAQWLMQQQPGIC